MNNQEILTSIKTKTIYDEIVKDKLLEMDSDGDGITEKALRDDRGRVISDAYELKKEKLDFLLVDYWLGAEGEFVPDTLSTGMIGIITDESAPYIVKKPNPIDEIIIAGTNSTPFVPISQTTIFVHPTTFERYRFNGTTMEVYDDVDGIVPKWLKYEALLTQTGTDAPVARVLNQDERDYLKIDWYRVAQGTYKQLYQKPIDLSLIIFPQTILFGDSRIVMYKDGEVNELYVDTADNTNSVDDGILSNTAISIKQRLRGASPKLLSAETNTAGDKIILTFDKKMSDYGISSESNGFEISGFDTAVFPERVINNNVVEINLETHIENGFDIYLLFDNNYIFESLDLGLLQSFTDFPVINNVLPS